MVSEPNAPWALYTKWLHNISASTNSSMSLPVFVFSTSWSPSVSSRTMQRSGNWATRKTSHFALAVSWHGRTCSSRMCKIQQSFISIFERLFFHTLVYSKTSEPNRNGGVRLLSAVSLSACFPGEIQLEHVLSGVGHQKLSQRSGEWWANRCHFDQQ